MCSTVIISHHPNKCNLLAILATFSLFKAFAIFFALATAKSKHFRQISTKCNTTCFANMAQWQMRQNVFCNFCLAVAPPSNKFCCVFMDSFDIFRQRTTKQDKNGQKLRIGQGKALAKQKVFAIFRHNSTIFINLCRKQGQIVQGFCSAKIWFLLYCCLRWLHSQIFVVVGWSHVCKKHFRLFSTKTDIRQLKTKCCLFLKIHFRHNSTTLSKIRQSSAKTNKIRQTSAKINKFLPHRANVAILILLTAQKCGILLDRCNL